MNLSQDIAQALAFLHANGIIHRDLSSNNVLLIAGSRAKVTDFGMSKFTDLNATHLSTMTQCPGTPAYMSPEALDESPVYTEKLDSFSFGVLLVQILCRKFPQPTDRFEIVLITSPRNPNQKVKTNLPVPEVERRQEHISMIDSTHSILPIALECLKDEAVERPSSQQLCQSLDALRDCMESLKQDVRQLLYEKEKEVEERDQHIKALRDEVKSKERQLQACNDLIEIKDLVILTKENDLVKKECEIQCLNDEIKAKHNQLKRLGQQLESNEKTTATLQHTITEREREIDNLRQQVAMHQRTIEQTKIKKDKEMDELIIAQEQQLRRIISKNPMSLTEKTDIRQRITKLRRINSKEEMFWESLPPGPISFSFVKTFAVVIDKVYLKTGRFLWQFNLTSNKWSQLCNTPLYDGFSLVNIEDELVVLGGLETKTRNLKDSNRLYSYMGETWEEKYPPMLSKRYECTAMYKDSILIVAGGLKGASTIALVEVLSMHTKQWSKASSLPIPISWPSISICGEHIYLQSSSGLTLKFSILSLAISTPTSAIWKEIANLPVKESTIVSVNGHLLAVGGNSILGNRTKEINYYNTDINLWQVISQMNIARSECAAALLPDNKLMVVGGTAKPESVELATVIKI